MSSPRNIALEALTCVQASLSHSTYAPVPRGLLAALAENPAPRHLIVVYGDAEDESSLRRALLARTERMELIPLPVVDLTLLTTHSLPVTLLHSLLPALDILEPKDVNYDWTISEHIHASRYKLRGMFERTSRALMLGRTPIPHDIGGDTLHERVLDSIECAEAFVRADAEVRALMDGIIERMRHDPHIAPDPLLIVPIVDGWSGINPTPVRDVLAAARTLRHRNVAIVVFTQRPDEYRV